MTFPQRVRGIKVQRMNHQVDEKGVSERKKGCLQCRVYNVQGPNHYILWHTDTNHKLVKWNFVIRSAIDG